MTTDRRASTNAEPLGANGEAGGTSEDRAAEDHEEASSRSANGPTAAPVAGPH